MPAGGLLFQLLIALGAALAGAAIALRLRQPLMLGYLLAGVAIGPFTPGITGQSEIIAQLAELGIVLLMFVIGIRLSLRELLRDSRVAIVGGLLQVLVMLGVGFGVGRLLGWGSLEAYAFGAIISNSSSTVLSKILSERGEVDSRHGRLGLAWSSVQDLSTVALAAVLGLFSTGSRGAALALGKAALFFFLLVPLAFLVLPWVLRRVASLHNRELSALAVVTVALSTAWGASVLGVSLALGAFLAGIVMGGTDLAHRVLGDAIPLRDVFAGIFFVSIGMLLDPRFLFEHWGLVLLALLLIVLVKGAVTAGLAMLVGSSIRLSVLIGAGLAQSGEFSFLLARVGVSQGVVSGPVFSLILSAAVLSILFAPLVNAGAPALLRWVQRRRPLAQEPLPERSGLEDHAIVCGYGRVGSGVCALLAHHQKPYLVIEEDFRLVESIRGQGIPVVLGDAAQPHVLKEARLGSARLLILCLPERMVVRRVVEHAREVNPAITVLARTHSDAERRFLLERGVAEPVMSERELALQLGRHALERFDVPAAEVARSIAEARANPA